MDGSPAVSLSTLATPDRTKQGVRHVSECAFTGSTGSTSVVTGRNATVRPRHRRPYDHMRSCRPAPQRRLQTRRHAKGAPLASGNAPSYRRRSSNDFLTPSANVRQTAGEKRRTAPAVVLRVADHYAVVVVADLDAVTAGLSRITRLTPVHIPSPFRNRIVRVSSSALARR